jgi:hypothetical protein
MVLKSTYQSLSIDGSEEAISSTGVWVAFEIASAISFVFPVLEKHTIEDFMVQLFKS